MIKINKTGLDRKRYSMVEVERVSNLFEKLVKLV